MSLANAILTVLALLAVATIPSVVGNLLAGWIARRWAAREQDRAMKRFALTWPGATARETSRNGEVGFESRAGHNTSRCPHLRNPELCDDCNNNPKGT